MGRPLRCFEPGRFYEISDRTLGQAYRLLPTAFVIASIRAAVVAAANVVPDVRVVGFTVMSNHWHLMLRAGHDPTGISRFMQTLKSIVARALKEHFELDTGLWSRRFAVITVLDDASVLKRLVYFIVNPVKAGLCAHFEEWTGVSTTAHLVGVASPADLDVPLALPPSWEGLTASELEAARAHLLDEVRAEEASIAAERMRLGKPRPRLERTLGRLRHSDSPLRSKHSRKPLCFAATAAVATAFRRTWRAWVAAYRVASAAFREGFLDVMFPACAQPPRIMRPPNEAAV